MNDLVAAHRAIVPDDPRSDSDITAAYAASPQAAQYAAGYPGFAAEVKGQQPAPYQPTAGQEFFQGAQSGLEGLASTAYGLGALGSSMVDAQGARDYFLAKAQAADQAAAENPPSVPDVSTALQSPSNAVHYAARKLGEIAPNAAQAVVTGLAGAALGGTAGAALEPAGGELPGAGAGALYGILESQATSQLIRQAAEQGIRKTVADLTAGEVSGAVKSLAANYGSKAAEVLNFWGQSAGSTYNTLSKNPNVDPDTAINVSILGGLAQAVPAAYLPSTILGKFFGDTASVGPYYARLASQAAKIVPGGVAAMSMQELAAIASEKYADPATRDQAFNLADWTAQDKSRLLESSVTGGLMGAVGVPFAAISRGAEPAAKPEAPKIDSVLKNYTGDLPANELHDLVTLAARELTGTLGIEGKQTLANLTGEQKNAYPIIKASVEKGFALPENKPAPGPTPEDIQQAYEQFKPQGQQTQPLTVHAPEVIEDQPATQASPVVPPVVEQPGTFPPEEGKPAVSVPPTVAPVVPVTAQSLTESPHVSAESAGNAYAQKSADQEYAGGRRTWRTQQAQASGQSMDDFTAKDQSDVDAAKVKFRKSLNLGDILEVSGDELSVDDDGHRVRKKVTKKYRVVKGENGRFEAEPIGDTTGPNLGLEPDSGLHFFNTLNAPTIGGEVLPRTLRVVASEEANSPRRTIPPTSTSDILGRARAASAGALSPDVPVNPDAYNPERQADIARYNQIKELTKQSFMSGKALPPEVAAEYRALQQKYGGYAPDASDDLIAQGKAAKAARDAAAAPKVEVAEPPAPTPAKVEEPVSAKNAPTEKPLFHENTDKAEVPGPINVESVSDGHPADDEDFKADYFEIPEKDAHDPKAIAKDLVSGAARGDRAQQTSNRVTVVRDNETGKVYALSTFNDKNARTVRIADPSKAGDERGRVSTKLSEFLGQKTADGEQKYTPIASAKLNEAKNGMIQEFRDEATYNREFGDPAKEKMAAALDELSKARSEAEALPAHTDATQGKTANYPFDAGHAEVLHDLFGKFQDSGTREDFEKEFTSIVRSKGDDANALREAIVPIFDDALQHGHSEAEALEITKGKIYDLLKDRDSQGAESFKESAVRRFNEGAVEPAETPAPPAGQQPAQRQQEGQGGSAVANPDALRYRKPDNGRNENRVINLTGSGESKVPFGPGQFWQDESGVLNKVTSHEAGARKILGLSDQKRYDDPYVTSALIRKGWARVVNGLFDIHVDASKLSRGQQQELTWSAIEQGKKLVWDRGDGSHSTVLYDPPDAATSFRRPTLSATTDASARHAQLLDTIHKAALDAGLNVTRIGQDISGLAGDFAKKTGASYDSASRTIAQVVGDVIGKEDVITSLHEVAHDVFSGLSAQDQHRALAAVDRLSDRQLGVAESSDPRIRASNPDALPQSVLAEERLVESTAMKLQEQGFDPAKARGLASSFVRALKDLYFRAAMSVQRALFGDSFINPELATRFFQNKVEAFLAGDFTKRSFIDMLGGGEARESMQARWHNMGDNPTFERIGPNNSLAYDNLPNSNLTAARFNNLKFRRPQSPDPDDMHSRQVEIEKQAARFNLKQEILETAAKNDEITRLAKELEIDPKELLLGRLGLTAPSEFKETLKGALEQDGKPVPYDPDKKIDGFKAKSNADSVTADAYRDVQSDLSHVSGVKTDARQDKADLIRRREKLLEAHQEAQDNYTDTQYSTSVATRALQDEGKRLLRDTATESKRMGSIAQQLKAIDPDADLKKYAPVFQKLFTGDELKGERLFNVLDTLANDPKIDFSKSIVDIRQQMLGRPEYAKFVQHTPESRALTAAIVSFAKTHAQVMANLELRRMANGADRVAIAKKLADLKTQGVQFTKAFKDLPRTAILEDRAKQAYRKSLAKVASASRRIEMADQRIKAADAMAEVLARHEAQLAGKLSIGAESVFRDGMPYNVPASADASNESVLASTKELKLNTARNELTAPDEVEADLGKMSAWLANREASYKAGNFDALDSVYQGVKRQRDQIAANKNFSLKVLPAQRFMIGLGALPDGKKVADGIGTPAARRVDQRMNRYTSDYMAMTDTAEKVGLRTVELEDKLLKLVPAKKADAREWMRTNMLNPAKDVFHHSDDLAEKYADNPAALKTAILNRVMTTLANQDNTAPLLKGHEMEWRKGLEAILDHQATAAQWELDRVREAGLGVLDPTLKTRNPATGQAVPATRQHIGKGAATFPQRMADNFRFMVNSLRNSGWTSADGPSLAHADFAHVGDAIDSGDMQAAHKLVDKYFNDADHGDQVRNEFFKRIAESNKESLFPAPLNEDGVTRPPVDVALQHQAYQESGGDPLKFAERMWELHDGQEIHGEEGENGEPGEPIQTKGSYMQSVMSSLADTAQEANNIFSSIESDPNRSETSIEGMSANALIDARFIAHLPSPWFDYHTFDQRDMFKTVERIAAERAFGREQTVLANDVRTVADEVKQAQSKLYNATQEIQRNHPEVQGKVLKKMLIEKLGADEYNRLDKMSRRANLVPQFVHGVSDYFRKDNAPDGTLRVMTRASYLLGSLMINQPSSALTLLTQLSDMNLRFGSSKAVLGQSVANLGRAGKEVAASLLNAIGVQLKADQDNQMWNDLGLGDPANVRKFADIFDRLHGETAAAHGFRAVSELMDTGIGKESPFTKFRPAGIFNWAGMIADKAITMGVWNLAKGQMSKGVDFYRSNLDHFNDPDFKLDADKLKLKGADADTFKRMTSLMERWGLNYDDMVRGAMTNPDKIGLTPEQALKLYSMAVSEIALSGNLSTMPTAAYKNQIIRFALPLLGWSFRRMAQVGQIGLNTEGQRDMKALARGMAGLSVTALGGLATASLINSYYSNVIGKQRNLRPILNAPDTKQFALGLIENLNRVGTVGLWGELVNGIANTGAGGDNRIFSVDGRVLAISSLQSIQDAIGAWLNQGTVDYQHVVRPLASATGGGSLLQYLDLANHALSLDNTEARIIARINAQNILRVAGRSLNLDVRQSQGGSFTPNLASPYLSAMEQSSYADDPAGFRVAYQQAIAAARALGHDDPAGYVKSAFESRNPLKSVFSTTPSQEDYARILASLSPGQAQDVQQSVSLFNQFAASIGAREFTGKKEKAEPEQALSLPTIRQRSAFALSPP